MKNAILVHGWQPKEEFFSPKYPTASNSHWFPWLSKQLIIRDIHTVAVEVPSGYYPEYEIWKREFERFDITPETILVGHSCGGGFLVRWLSENDIRVNKVILVAPWMGVSFGNEEYDHTFFKFDTKRSLVSQTHDGLYIFNSTDDFTAIHKSVEMLKESVDDIQYREFQDKGHFCIEDLGTEEFPELLEEILR